MGVRGKRRRGNGVTKDSLRKGGGRGYRAGGEGGGGKGSKRKGGGLAEEGEWLG